MKWGRFLPELIVSLQTQFCSERGHMAVRHRLRWILRIWGASLSGEGGKGPRQGPANWANPAPSSADGAAGARFQAMTAARHMPISRHSSFTLPSISKTICEGSICSTFSKVKTIVPAWTVTGPPFAQNL